MSQVVVVSENKKGLEHKITAGNHTLVADAPVDVGGAAAGPDPHDLMLSALGACTSMTMQIFAKKRGWELRKVNVTLNEEKVDDPQNPGKQMYKITRDIKVEGNLDKEQLDSLRAIADKCPIHKLLTGSKQIETNLVS